MISENGKKAKINLREKGGNESNLIRYRKSLWSLALRLLAGGFNNRLHFRRNAVGFGVIGRNAIITVSYEALEFSSQWPADRRLPVCGARWFAVMCIYILFLRACCYGCNLIFMCSGPDSTCFSVIAPARSGNGLWLSWLDRLVYRWFRDLVYDWFVTDANRKFFLCCNGIDWIMWCSVILMGK